MASGYRLLSYTDGGKPKAGVLVGDQIVPAAALLKGVDVDATSVLGLLRTWDAVHPRLHDAAQNTKASDGILLAQAKLLAPILYPGALFCAGANYWDHLEEMAEIAKRVTGKAPAMTKGKDPYFFMKTAAGSIIGSGTPARLPPFSQQVDWEAELGAVIARPTRNISEDRAPGCRRRLSDRQRPVRARPDEARRLALRHGLGRAEMFRGRSTDGAVADTRRLYPRSQ